ncbi:effector-associated constant component EACC1 [Streptomyces sp. CB03234]|uniref:effector-associated constant component EACC1 n=1 Tax=Streptomyces sp. (strain CB03234) TaxID=1703937 RepID=UPI00117F1AB0|nr:hypothetical protein [Streptomyces sp. CB03234]
MTELRVGISVEDAATDTGVHDLRRRLAGEPELRGRIRTDGSGPLPAGAMGLATDALLAVLEPGGVVTTFAAGLVTWLAARRTECTVTVTRPDGTQITLTATRIRNLTAQQRAEFVREITAALDESGPERE